MTPLTHALERTVVIRARRETVFAFLTESPLWASWWGPGSEIHPQPGGRVLIRHPNGVEVHGEVVEVDAPSRIVFTYRAQTGHPADSCVTIRLDDHEQGTRLHLTHEFASTTDRDAHVQGWRYQLSVFVNLLSNTRNHVADEAVDLWFAAWNDTDDGQRDRAFATIAAPDVAFTDRYSHVATLADLQAHIAAVHRFMPGLRLVRSGPVRHCQWRALADWTARGADGVERGRGVNVFDLDKDGRIAAVTGFWA
jgi:uncharacterized protein YndB with AHSA1/START domain